MKSTDLSPAERFVQNRRDFPRTFTVRDSRILPETARGQSPVGGLSGSGDANPLFSRIS
jgi:hypothetical protein